MVSTALYLRLGSSLVLVVKLGKEVKGVSESEAELGNEAEFVYVIFWKFC